jgi:hypothetical protein
MSLDNLLNGKITTYRDSLECTLQLVEMLSDDSFLDVLPETKVIARIYVPATRALIKRGVFSDAPAESSTEPAGPEIIDSKVSKADLPDGCRSYHYCVKYQTDDTSKSNYVDGVLMTNGDLTEKSTYDGIRESIVREGRLNVHPSRLIVLSLTPLS